MSHLTLQRCANEVSQELILGLFEAFSSLVKHPYLGAKKEGPLGVPKGVGRGIGAFLCHLMAGKPSHNIDLLSFGTLTCRCGSGLGRTRLLAQRDRAPAFETPLDDASGGIVSYQA